MIFRKFLREPKLWCAQGEFGGRTGLWRLLDVFGEFDVRTTLFLPGQTGLLYPEVLRRAVREGHEIANHMWDHHIPPTLEEEAVHMDRTDTLIKGLTGQYPGGHAQRARPRRAPGSRLHICFLYAAGRVSLLCLL